MRAKFLDPIGEAISLIQTRKDQDNRSATRFADRCAASGPSVYTGKREIRYLPNRQSERLS
jgi:hypothetical protein